MGIWKLAIGATIGFLAGGPAGGYIGAMAGLVASRGENDNNSTCNPVANTSHEVETPKNKREENNHFADYAQYALDAHDAYELHSECDDGDADGD